MSRALTALAMLGSSVAFADERGLDHAAWDLLLKRHVASGLVDYEGFRQDRAALDRYAAHLQDVQPSQLGSPQAQLAFWINAYNANVVKGVLEHSPIASVKEVKGFFDRIRYRVAGRDLTLNEIEGEGRVLGDWRIHFAVVCASSSCPLLRAEAYQPSRISEQLDDQAARFLNDPVHGFRVDGNVMWVSKIFKWYANDFVPSDPLTPASLWPLIDRYITREESLFADPARLTLKFLDYDWSLNEQH